MPHRNIGIVATAFLLLSCGHHQTIPTSEIKEIRQLAFDSATKRYLIPDASIDSQYEVNLRNHLETKEKREKKPAANEPDFDFEKAAWRRYGPIPAIASVRGVQVNPSTPKLCLIKFDFEPSHNLHARLPQDEATAEGFERPDGSHYWTVVWK